MGFLRSRRPILPLAICVMTAALAYAAGKRRSLRQGAGEHTRAGVPGRRASGRRPKPRRSRV
jgi:hypothetical protein